MFYVTTYFCCFNSKNVHAKSLLKCLNTIKVSGKDSERVPKEQIIVSQFLKMTHDAHKVEC